MLPLLEVLARIQLPWWVMRRADALLNLSEAAWKLVRKSRLKMAYIGAETPNDTMLGDIRKGTTSDQTLAGRRTVPTPRRGSRAVFHGRAAG